MLEALKITEENYDRYLQLPTAENEDHLDFEEAKNHFIVKDVQDLSTWRCLSKENFDAQYEFIAGESHPTRFRMLINK